MEVMLTSTDKIVDLVVEGTDNMIDPVVPARIWEGVTAGGVRCHAYVTRIAVAEHDDASEFEAELQQAHATPSHAVEAIPLRLIL